MLGGVPHGHSSICSLFCQVCHLPTELDFLLEDFELLRSSLCEAGELFQLHELPAEVDLMTWGITPITLPNIGQIRVKVEELLHSLAFICPN